MKNWDPAILTVRLWSTFIHNMTSDYDLQLAMMEMRIKDKLNPLTVDEIRDDINLRFERLNKNPHEKNEI